MKKYKEVIQSYKIINEFFNKENYVNFMNHGYYPESKILKKEDLFFKYEASLYIYLLNNIDTNNMKLLDVGCGRGGGINIYKKYFNFLELHGCDINKEGIEFCKKTYKNINFKICPVEKLNYKNNYFDIITNVESFSYYKNPQLALKELFRILKPNGLLLLTDIDLNFKIFKNYKILNIEEITPNVAFACKENVYNFAINAPIGDNKKYLIKLCQDKFIGYLLKHRYNIIKCIK
jgi:2-polyprenyl-3-methyl-5-hydroxy-6-metoxy-1,4-benzoquinol methylase